MVGTIIKGVGGNYFVKAENSCIYECKARGIFRKDKIKPMIGDRVEIEILTETTGSIDKIFERKSSLIRPPVANIDTVIVVMAAKNPEPDYLLADKIILMALTKNINPVICITKTDLDNGDDIKKIYEKTGYKIFEVCSVDNTGIDELRDFLKNKTSVFAGLSGVGKSSLLNLLVEDDLETGEISRINRGRHTTRHVELFELKDGGYVFDTPGFSSFENDALKTDSLDSFYPEMNEYTGKCRFADCVHINEPGCAVKEALSNGLISQVRYENYCAIHEILKQFKDWENK